MTANELAALCLRVRALFGGAMDEDIFALHVRWMKDKDFAVCMAALNQYALDFGGTFGRFLPSKFREYHDCESTAAAERRRDVASHQARIDMDLGVSRVDMEWFAVRRDLASIDAATIETAVNFLESLGWHRPDGDPGAWPRTWVLAVSDLARDRNVDGMSARLFWSRTLPPSRRSSAAKQGL